jgi:hypothetical protein
VHQQECNRQTGLITQLLLLCAVAIIAELHCTSMVYEFIFGREDELQKFVIE